LSGDIGLGAVYTQAQIRGADSKTEVMPYLNFEVANAFARIDTFGVKTLPVGYGHLEVVGQYRGDGYEATGLERRGNSLPLGLGTLQITPIGAFGLQVLHDFGTSEGTLVQARYLAELPWGAVHVYPELGVEYQSQAYTGYYYGTTPADAASLGQAYRPSAAVNPYFGAMIEVRLADHWYANVYLRRTLVDDTIAQSPLLTLRTRDSVLLALAYHF
jgi:outer membrane protein